MPAHAGPSFLRQRAARARAASDDAAARLRAQAAQAAQIAVASQNPKATARSQPASGPQHSQAAPNSTTEPQKTAQKRQSRAKAAKTAPGSEGGANRGETGQTNHSDAPLDVRGLVQAIRPHSGRADLFDAIGDRLDPAISALLLGAARPGHLGSADRSVLWRMLALPWAQTVQGGEAAARALGQAIGDRLGSAVARIEAHRAGSGRRTVTLDALPEPEPRETLASAGDARMFTEHERASGMGDQADQAQHQAEAAAEQEEAPPHKG